ncbi:MAG: 1-acyl-sn-glycerol-3-phosphate acyltransferase [Acidimicrobiales bacterium]|nr:1-acyl-sn-glycerol-3-phosphate acyltransferase [Acidimicrobiales bacterium]RZV46201.1 MAG: 1-acyl-sn-glycerol-3-phosphate acyltransferase [Acidimicrobiales bacterium]
MFEQEYGADLTRLQRVVWVLARALVVAITTLYFRAEVHGRENLPTSGAFILGPVHRSNLDTPLLPAIRKEPIRFMGKDSLWNVGRVAAWVLTTLGGFPVERGSADRGALRAAEDVLERGETLVMFPEGTRRSGPIVQEENMFDGPSFLAGRQQVPIVPVGIGGSEAAMPIGRKVILPKKVVFVIGTPIPPPEPNANGRVPRRLVKEHTAIVMDRVQEVFDDAMELAGTPNPPRGELDSAE